MRHILYILIIITAYTLVCYGTRGYVSPCTLIGDAFIGVSIYLIYQIIKPLISEK